MTETISVTAKQDLFHGPTLSNENFASKTEEMSGDVILQGPDKQKRYVHIKVYRTSLEHFAVVYPLKRLSKPMGIINIRNTCVTSYDESEGKFIINQKMFDVTTSIELHCDPNDLPKWIKAFTSRSSPALIHQTSLPMVKEEDTD